MECVKVKTQQKDARNAKVSGIVTELAKLSIGKNIRLFVRELMRQ